MGINIQGVSALTQPTTSPPKQITRNSEFNHAYARRPLHARDPFYVFWADGDPREESKSHLYFGNSTGERYWQLPYDMAGDFATPIERSGHGNRGGL